MSEPTSATPPSSGKLPQGLAYATLGGGCLTTLFLAVVSVSAGALSLMGVSLFVRPIAILFALLHGVQLAVAMRASATDESVHPLAGDPARRAALGRRQRSKVVNAIGLCFAIAFAWFMPGWLEAAAKAALPNGGAR